MERKRKNEVVRSSTCKSCSIELYGGSNGLSGPPGDRRLIGSLAPFLVSIVTFRRFPGNGIFSGCKLSRKINRKLFFVKLKPG
jgi:hypothetical protein